MKKGNLAPKVKAAGYDKMRGKLAMITKTVNAKVAEAEKAGKAEVAASMRALRVELRAL